MSRAGAVSSATERERIRCASPCRFPVEIYRCAAAVCMAAVRPRSARPPPDALARPEHENAFVEPQAPASMPKRTRRRCADGGTPRSGRKHRPGRIKPGDDQAPSAAPAPWPRAREGPTRVERHTARLRRATPRLEAEPRRQPAGRPAAPGCAVAGRGGGTLASVRRVRRTARAAASPARLPQGTHAPSGWTSCFSFRCGAVSCARMAVLLRGTRPCARCRCRAASDRSAPSAPGARVPDRATPETPRRPGRGPAAQPP